MVINDAIFLNCVGSNHTWLTKSVNDYLQDSIERVFRQHGGQLTPRDGVVVIPKIPGNVDSVFRSVRIGFRFLTSVPGAASTELVWGDTKSFFTGGRMEESRVKEGGYETYVRQTKEGGSVLGLVSCNVNIAIPSSLTSIIELLSNFCGPPKF